MHLDELGAQEEFDQLPVRTDPELLADVTSWGGVQRSCDLNVVVGVYLGIGPERHVERLGARRKQGRLLDRLEHVAWDLASRAVDTRSEEHTSELQSRENLVCRLLLEKKKKNIIH